MQIFDTAGRSEFSVLRSIWIAESDGSIIVYSISSKNTFEETKEYFQQVKREKDGAYIPLLLVGNKIDIEDKREVTTEKGRELANQFQADFFETSALKKINIDESFFHIVKKIRFNKSENTFSPEMDSKNFSS